MKYLTLFALLCAEVWCGDHDAQVQIIKDVMRASTQGFESALYQKDIEVKENCGGVLDDALLDTFLTAVEHLQEEDRSTAIFIILAAIQTFMKRNSAECLWSATLQDLGRYCWTQWPSCSRPVVIYRALEKKEQYLPYLKDLVKQISTQATTHDEIVDKYGSISTDLGTIIQVLTQFSS